jgi:hypothetical protein
MPRFLIQSKATGRFLCPALDGGEPVWVSSLREAGGGVITDIDAVHQLVHDNCESEDEPMLIDLDRLGTENDYPVTGS